MKKRMKKIVTVMLAGAMILSLAGCGGGNADKPQESKKDFYYVPENRKLDINSNYIEGVVAKDDQIYMYGNSWDEESGISVGTLYCYDLVNDTMKEIPFKTENNLSIYRMFLNEAGNLMMIVQRYEEVTSMEKVVDVEVPEESDETDIAQDTDGVEVVSEIIIGGDDFYADAVEFRQYIEMVEVSVADGSVMNSVDITAVFENSQDFYPQYVTTDANDNIYISDGNSCIYVIDASGNKLAEITLDDWIDGMFSSKEGTTYIKMWGTEGEEIRPVDLNNKKIGATVDTKGLVERSNHYNQRYYKGIESSLLVSDSTGLFTYDFTTDAANDLFEWLDVDINSDDVYEAGQMSDGRYWALLHDYMGEEAEYYIAIMKKTPASEVVIKEELVYGTIWTSQEIRKNIIDFNKTSDKYRITVKEYQTDDYTSGIAQFNNDLASGNCPDIINLSNLDFARYASKGVFEDLYPYMEKDGIQKDDYVENVLKAYEMSGKLYGIIPQFYIHSAAVKSSIAGDRTGWTVKEMLEVAKESGIENIFQYGSRMSVFYYCIYNNMDEYIDWETGECFFNGEDFINVLEFAAQFPEEPDYSDEESISFKIHENKVLLLETSVSSVQEYQMMSGMFGEEITFIGYPNSEGKGNLIQPTNECIAIAAKSEKKEAAWEFVKGFMSDEYQDGLVSEHANWGFPLKKSALEKQFEMDMTPSYYEDMDGKQVERPKTSWGYDDFQIDIYAAKKEEVDAVRKVIASAERTATSINEELATIITEETDAYFKGQKSAKETADIIQNRIQIYVNENS